jgi:RecB family endonuclease NucS
MDEVKRIQLTEMDCLLIIHDDCTFEVHGPEYDLAPGEDEPEPTMAEALALKLAEILESWLTPVSEEEYDA